MSHISSLDDAAVKHKEEDTGQNEDDRVYSPATLTFLCFYFCADVSSLFVAFCYLFETN